MRQNRLVAGGILFGVLVAGCDQAPTPAEPPTSGVLSQARGNPAAADGPHTFGPAVFDIAAAPDGGLLVAENTRSRRSGATP